MSIQSSFQRNRHSELFSSLLNPQESSSSAMNLTPDRYNLSFDNRHQQRPVSEILKHESFISPETQVLNKWFEDLQDYESSLEGMANASLDPNYKEEVQHVDQWFRYLNEAERTATIYTLLQHSTQVQARFFITVLQQMTKKDPLAALLSPSHPEKVDMQTQLAGAMVKAELEASQKLLSVLPYQTGQVNARPVKRQPVDNRHSFALGDNTDEYNRLFKSDFFGDTGLLPQRTLERPKSVIEASNSIFSSDWPYGANLISRPPPAPTNNVTSRPKSADISSWSLKGKESTPWSPTVSTFNETDDVDQLSISIANNWHINSNRSSAIIENSRGSNRSSRMMDIPVVLSTMYDDSMYNAAPNKKVYGQFLNVEENGYYSDHSENSKTGVKKKEKKIVDIVDMQLLEDVPAWLRSLRLHKYNAIFEHMKWHEMLKLDEAALLAKGVAALGARRKLLKVFDQIKAHCQANNIAF